MNYLFPTDGSEHSKQAENVLEQILKSRSDRVQVLTVINENPHPLLKPEKKAEYEAGLMERAEAVVDATARRLRTKGFQVETTVHHGNPGSVICALAKDKNADGIVMGRRGHGTAAEMLLGSVSRYVIHHADCPVTVVPPKIV